MIVISIDVTLLDKARFKRVTRKNGKDAVFCDLVLIATPESKYGDFMVKQGVTKEESQARIEMPILGNGKEFSGAKKSAAKSSPPASGLPEEPEDDEVPF